MSLFQKIHPIEHNRHDVYMYSIYIYIQKLQDKRKRKEQNKTN